MDSRIDIKLRLMTALCRVVHETRNGVRSPRIISTVQIRGENKRIDVTSIDISLIFFLLSLLSLLLFFFTRLGCWRISRRSSAHGLFEASWCFAVEIAMFVEFALLN